MSDSYKFQEAGAANLNKLLKDLAVLQAVKQLASQEYNDHPGEDNISQKGFEKVSCTSPAEQIMLYTTDESR